jgi:hypothetical protein
MLESIDINQRRVAESAATGRTTRIQFSEPSHNPALLEQIDGLCRVHGHRVEVRFFGHRKNVFDAGILKYLPSVQSLSIDCMDDIENESQIAKLEHLRRFSFQVQNLDRPQFLSTLNTDSLEVLTLMGTRKNNLDLTALARAHRLRKLTVERHRKGIQHVTGAPLLEQLALWGYPRAQSLAFVADLAALRYLGIIRGGRETLDDVRHDTLQFLNVTWVNGLHDLGPIRRFKELRGLLVSDQIRLDSIDLTGSSIKMLGLDNCKHLKELVGLDDLSGLEQFSAIRTALPLDRLRDRTWPKSLRVLRLLSPSQRWNEATRAKLADLGYKELGERWFQSDLDETYESRMSNA